MLIIGAGPGGTQLVPERNLSALRKAGRARCLAEDRPLLSWLVPEGVELSDDPSCEVWVVPGDPTVDAHPDLLDGSKVLSAMSFGQALAEFVGTSGPVSYLAGDLRAGFDQRRTTAFSSQALASGALAILNARLEADREVGIAWVEAGLLHMQRLKWADISHRMLLTARAILVPARPAEHPGGLYGLVEIVDRLLGPGGCPWDQEQTHASLKPYLLEEAYEVLDAIDSGSMDKLREELGDLMLQPVMHAQMQARDGGFDVDAVAASICEKLIRRHPHVFGDAAANNADEVLKNWDRIKQAERGREESKSILAGIPRAMPSLVRALEISKRAARVGFEWPDLEGVIEKLVEELAELNEAIRSGDRQQMESELGDLLFTIVNVGRWLKVDPEGSLRQMLDRFSGRFASMEQLADRPLRELSADDWESLWQRAKQFEVSAEGNLAKPQ